MSAESQSEKSAYTELVRRLASSHFNYWAGYVANISLVIWLLSFALLRPQYQLTLKEWTLYTVTGLALWTFVEYFMHRWIYHEFPSFLSIGHGLHHDTPKALLGVPWYLTTVVLVAIFYLMTYFFNPGSTGVVMAFTWVGYLGYCYMHHSIHHFDFKNAWFKSMKRHHMYHHVHPATNWGMLTSFWDHVFRTNAK